MIAGLVLFFVFLKKRKSKLTNQSPDFNNDSGLDSFGSEKGGSSFGFKKLFGSKVSSGAGAGGALAGINDLERQMNRKAGETPGYQNLENDDQDNDFVYRGVANSNNLDSVFKPLANNLTGQNTASLGHTRYNSTGGNSSPAPPYPASAHSEEFIFGSIPLSDEHNPLMPIHQEEDRVTSGEFNPSDYDLELEEDEDKLVRPSMPGTNETESRNSKSRFTEEIL